MCDVCWRTDDGDGGQVMMIVLILSLSRARPLRARLGSAWRKSLGSDGQDVAGEKGSAPLFASHVIDHE